MKLGKKQQSETGGMFEINMTPLIDVSLVLVCILLLSSPLAFESSIAVKKSAAAAAQAEKILPDDRVELQVISADSVLVNGATMVARRDLRGMLTPLLDKSRERLVLVGCEDGVPHGAFVDVLDHAKISGALEIAVVGR